MKPKTKLQAEAIKIHLIRECDLEEAEDINDVIEEFLEYIGNRTLVGYYLEFDNQGIKEVVPDYRKAFQQSSELLLAISKINGLMADKGFPLNGHFVGVLCS